MVKKLFLISFLIALFCQYFTWSKLSRIDVAMWANQAKYVLTNDSKQFDFNSAYGHPGASIIDGTILIHFISHLSFINSLTIFLTIFNSFLIGTVTVFCYLLKPKSLWWAGTIAFFSFNHLNNYATPPTAISAMLVTLLFLISFAIYQTNPNLNKNKYLLILWGITAGLSFATRVDISIISIFAFLVFLKKKLPFKDIFRLLIVTCSIFIIVNPYMWYMPIRHLKDLVYKVTLHYSNFSPTPISFGDLFKPSSLAILSIILAIGLLFSKKKINFPLPKILILILGVISLIVSLIILTSKYQSLRYFIPLLFIWELLFPLFTLTLINYAELKFIKNPIKRHSIKNILSLLIIALIAFSQAFLSVTDSVFVTDSIFWVH